MRTLSNKHGNRKNELKSTNPAHRLSAPPPSPGRPRPAPARPPVAMAQFCAMATAVAAAALWVQSRPKRRPLA